MKKLLTILLFALTCCSVKNGNQKSNFDLSSIDSTILTIDTTTILGAQYKAIFRTDNLLYVIRNNTDTIQIEKDLYRDFAFEDFNSDNLNDIRIHHLANVPGIQDLLLFDKLELNFKRIDGFTNYPDPKRIEQTKYYYSYHRSGCADNNWDSDLFYIENYKIQKIGTIAGRQCENQDIKDGIYIYRIIDGKEIKVDSFPIDKLEEYNDDKWGFIEKYWIENYLNFES